MEYNSDEIKSINTKKPVVLVVGASGFAGDVFFGGVKKILDNSYNIVPFSYKKDSYTKVDEPDEELVKDFSKNVIMPRVMSGSGQKLSNVLAMKNLRNLNIISHNFGSDLVEKSFKQAKQDMKNLGYSNNVCDEILKQCFHISYNSPLEEKLKEKTATTFELLEKDSNLFGEKYDKYFKEQNITQTYLKAGVLKRRKNDLILATNNLIGEKNKKLYEEALVELEQIFNKMPERDENFELVLYELYLSMFGPNKNLEKNSRINAITDFIRRAIQNSVKNALNSNNDEMAFVPNFDEEKAEENLEEIIKEENNSNFEDEQEKLFRYKNFGKPLTESMQEFGITYFELINGMVLNIDEFLEYATTYNGEVVDIDFEGTDLNMDMLRINLEQHRLNQKIQDEDYLLDCECGKEMLGIIMEDGESFNSFENNVDMQKDWIRNSAIAMKINQKYPKNNIVYKFVKNGSDSTKNFINIESGLMLEGGPFDSVEEAKRHQVSSIKGDFVLSEKQTRVILNLAIATKTPFENILLPPNLSLNKNVLMFEAGITKDGKVVNQKTSKKPNKPIKERELKKGE
ncbi:MAG: hypothetical protein IJ837_01165 [Clostridia bacterium]|nr:hypothetical protein [Clostridia bacterium]